MKLKNQNFIKPFYEATKKIFYKSNTKHKYIIFLYIKFTSQKNHIMVKL